MAKIAFFCIPAYGHTNPTIEVVRELVNRGNEVWYYSYEEFREKIESTGAKFIACNEYDKEQNLKPEDASRVGKDIAFSTRILVDTTLALDDMLCKHMKEFQPDCIVADSMAVWGKAIAIKFNIPFVSSTTTFAFNQHSAKIMKQSFSQIINMIISMPSVNKDIKRLQDKGYKINNILDIIQNDNETNTIVYTSMEFQPFAETFSDKYTFVGPSIRKSDTIVEKSSKKTVYISLGTVNNILLKFYKNCIKAFENSDYEIIMSVGKNTDISELGNIPNNFTVQNSVNQIDVLQKADIFITHCGMNSANESIYYGVPMVLFPQTSEQGGVARRISDFDAGIYLKKNNPQNILESVNEILKNSSYKQNVMKIRETFIKSGGASQAVDAILKVASNN